MAHRIPATTRMASSKAKVASDGMTAMTTKVISWKIISMGMVLIPGRMEESFKVIGNIIRCMVMACSPGLMVANIKVNT